MFKSLILKPIVNHTQAEFARRTGECRERIKKFMQLAKFPIHLNTRKPSRFMYLKMTFP